MFRALPRSRHTRDCEACDHTLALNSPMSEPRCRKCNTPSFNRRRCFSGPECGYPPGFDEAHCGTPECTELYARLTMQGYEDSVLIAGGAREVDWKKLNRLATHYTVNGLRVGALHITGVNDIAWVLYHCLDAIFIQANSMSSWAVNRYIETGINNNRFTARLDEKQFRAASKTFDNLHHVYLGDRAIQLSQSRNDVRSPSTPVTYAAVESYDDEEGGQQPVNNHGGDRDRDDDEGRQGDDDDEGRQGDDEGDTLPHVGADPVVVVAAPEEITDENDDGDRSAASPAPRKKSRKDDRRPPYVTAKTMHMVPPTTRPVPVTRSFSDVEFS